MAYSQLFTILAPSTLATDYVVGDNKVFNYPGGVHNEVKVSRNGFHQCAAPLRSEPLTSGKDVIKLATPGRKWYICGVAMHCAVGDQKLARTVLPSSFASSPSPIGNTHTRSFGAK